MIPEKMIRTAEAEYFCNVSEFIGLGEGKKVSPREVCGIKDKHRSVQDWFDQLDVIGQLQVMKYLRKESERSAWSLIDSIAQSDT